MSRARRPLVRPGRKIDFKEWSSILGISLTMTSDQTLLGAGIAFGQSLTILRCRTTLLIGLEAPVAAGDIADITLGLAVISTDAFLAGVAGVPDPGDDPGYPWLFWKSYTLRSESATVQSPVGRQVVRQDIDTKAMRKVTTGQTLCWIVQRVNIVGDPPVNVDFGQTRVLLGL